MSLTVEALAQEIRRQDVFYNVGADELSARLLPFIERHIAAGQKCDYCNGHGAVGLGENSDVCPVCTPRAPIELPKPTGAVPLPEPDRGAMEVGGEIVFCYHSEKAMRAYGDAREAAVNSPMRAAIRMMAQALANGEWAEHVLDFDPDMSALESEITRLIGRADAWRADAVPAQLSEAQREALSDSEHDGALAERAEPAAAPQQMTTQGEALPRPLKGLLHFTEHCISAAEEGVDYAASREWLDAMTTMGIMEKVGRGKWAPTDHAEAVARLLAGPQS